MLYKLFPLLIFLFIPIEIDAQISFLLKGPRNISSMKVIDYGNIKIKYVLNLNEKNRYKCDDVHILEIGHKMSRYYSYNIYQSDSVYTDFIKRNPYAQSVPYPAGHNPTRSNKYFWSDLFKDYNKNILTEYAYMPKNIPNYQYSEEIPNFDWIIHSDSLIVMTYLCQKATCSFRGRNYTAWFSTDIPSNNGPWKFGGLPGLILKMYDDNKDFVFECISIENPKTLFGIKCYDYSNCEKISRNKLLELWKNIFTNYFHITGVTFTGNYKPEKIPYKTLELE